MAMTGGTASRAGIVGCGTVAATHATAYRAATGVDLAACCDVLPAKARAFAERSPISPDERTAPGE